MRSCEVQELVPFDPEIERTFHRRRRETRESMAEETEEPAAIQMMDYVQPIVLGNTSSITKPRVQANTFEIKPAIIQMIQTSVQFGGSATDDPNAHIANFLELCDTFKQNGVTDDAIRLRLFPFSLRDKAKSWLNSFPTESITTWEMMTKAFLSKYFPPSKTAKMRNDITNFVQHDTETLYEAWERFKELLRRCLHHGLPVWIQVGQDRVKDDKDRLRSKIRSETSV
ncbi:uncharacterized protein [Henckelia pumila]|uniref:uncharacterized protein isoform X1 n=1 Tax=Henckelia pumila TaxID=405737 RepID=UPI003C6DCE15